jgi:putative ABC transport system substrate-binding protein
VTGKQLELLRETVPGLSRVAVLWDANWSPFPPVYYAPAQALRLELLPLAVRGPDELDSALEAATQRRVDGLLPWPGLSLVAVAAMVEGLQS